MDTEPPSASDIHEQTIQTDTGSHSVVSTSVTAAATATGAGDADADDAQGDGESILDIAMSGMDATAVRQARGRFLSIIIMIYFNLL